MDAKPLVSVVVPVYNVAAYLPDCIESLLAQTLAPIELIFVNDASTDESLDILRRYAAQYPGRMTVIDAPENRCQGGARNLGLRAAKADWVGWIDSDDFITPAMYQVLYDAVQNTGADAAFVQYAAVPHSARPADCFSDTGAVAAALPPLIDWDARLRALSGKELDDDARMDLICCPIGGLVCGLWRKSIFVERGLWFPEKARYEDNYWGPLAKLTLQKAVFVPQVHYLYRQVAASTTHMRNQPHIGDRVTMEHALLAKVKALGVLERYRPAWEYLYGWRYAVNTAQTYLRTFDAELIPFDKIAEIAADLDAEFPHWQENRYYCSLVTPEQRAVNAQQLYHTKAWLAAQQKAAKKAQRKAAAAHRWDVFCRTVKKALGRPV